MILINVVVKLSMNKGLMPVPEISSASKKKNRNIILYIYLKHYLNIFDKLLEIRQCILYKIEFFSKLVIKTNFE